MALRAVARARAAGLARSIHRNPAYKSRARHPQRVRRGATGQRAGPAPRRLISPACRRGSAAVNPAGTAIRPAVGINVNAGLYDFFMRAAGDARPGLSLSFDLTFVQVSNLDNCCRYTPLQPAFWRKQMFLSADASST